MPDLDSEGLAALNLDDGWVPPAEGSGDEPADGDHGGHRGENEPDDDFRPAGAVSQPPSPGWKRKIAVSGGHQDGQEEEDGQEEKDGQGQGEFQEQARPASKKTTRNQLKKQKTDSKLSTTDMANVEIFFIDTNGQMSALSTSASLQEYVTYFWEDMRGKTKSKKRRMDRLASYLRTKLPTYCIACTTIQMTPCKFKEGESDNDNACATCTNKKYPCLSYRVKDGDEVLVLRPQSGDDGYGYLKG